MQQEAWTHGTDTSWLRADEVSGRPKTRGYCIFQDELWQLRCFATSRLTTDNDHLQCACWLQAVRQTVYKGCTAKLDQSTKGNRSINGSSTSSMQQVVCTFSVHLMLLQC